MIVASRALRPACPECPAPRTPGERSARRGCGPRAILRSSCGGTRGGGAKRCILESISEPRGSRRSWWTATTASRRSRAPASTSRRPGPLWSEQAPEDWWSAACRAVDELAAGHRSALAATRAIGLSGQMHGATLLDARGEVLRPAILWNDGRSGAECAALEAAGPGFAPDHRQPRDAGLQPRRSSGGSPPTSPRSLPASRRVLLPKDYLRVPAERRARGRDVGRVGDPVARRREPALVAGDARRHRARSRAHAAPRGGLRAVREPRARARATVGHVGRGGHRRRGGRQRGRGGRHRDGGAGAGPSSPSAPRGSSSPRAAPMHRIRSARSTPSATASRIPGTRCR